MSFRLNTAISSSSLPSKDDSTTDDVLDKRRLE